MYAGDESRCSVLRSLQAANDDISDTVQRSITVVQVASDEGLDECSHCIVRHRTTDRSQLVKLVVIYIYIMSVFDF